MNIRDFIMKVIDILGNDSDPAIERRLKRLEDAVFGLHNVAQRPDVKPPEVKVKRQYYRREAYGGAIDIVRKALTVEPKTIAQIAAETGVKERTVGSRLSELKKQGVAEWVATGTYRRKA
jgi:DNA-binding Lrp family transcriptional regulator